MTTNTLEMRGHTASVPNPGSAEAEFRNLAYGRGAGMMHIGIGSSNGKDRRHATQKANSMATSEE